MNKISHLKILIEKYLSDSLSEPEKADLFELLKDHENENVVIAELYKYWHKVPNRNRKVNSQAIFEDIREKLAITDEQLQKDELILKGLEAASYEPNRKFQFYSIIRYAAVAAIAFIITLTGFYVFNVGFDDQMALNEINVPYGSKAKITLSDSSTVWLNAGSKFQYPNNFSKSARTVYLEGEAFFDVKKDMKNPFYVKTTDINIKVTGTSFNVKSYPEENIIETTLITGSVQIEEKDEVNVTSEQFLLKPSEKASYYKENNTIKIDEARTIDNLSESEKSYAGETDGLNHSLAPNPSGKLYLETAWKDNQLIFRNESFGSLSKRLERWYNIDIVIRNSQVNEYVLTGSFREETVEQAMNALKMASGLDYTMNKNRIEVFLNNN